MSAGRPYLASSPDSRPWLLRHGGSDDAQAKARHAEGALRDSVHSFAGLIDHLGTMTRNTMRMPLAKMHPLHVAFQIDTASGRSLQASRNQSGGTGNTDTWNGRPIDRPARPAIASSKTEEAPAKW